MILHGQAFFYPSVSTFIIASLERIYSVSRTTVRRAIAKLSEEGYVQVRQGYGTMVLKNIYPSETFEFSRLHHFENTLSIRHVNVPNPEKMSARGMYINTVPADKVVSEALQVKLKAAPHNC